MAPNYKIALIQFQPKDLAVEENFQKAESYLRKAALGGAHLAVLPEYHLTSWCPEHPSFVAACAESSADNSYLARYQALARELNINIVPGTICEVHPASSSSSSSSSFQGKEPPSDDGDSGKQEPATWKGQPIEIRNMAYWISASTGDLAGSYQKMNLWHPERPHLTAGDIKRHRPHRAFDTPFLKPGPNGTQVPIRAGLLICWDLAFPEGFRALIADGADMIIVPSYWWVTAVDENSAKISRDAEKIFLGSVCVTRACENTAAIVFCNAGGMSQVALPLKGVLPPVGEEWDGKKGVMGAETEEMQIVDVDFEVLRVAEEDYKVRMDMGGKGWHYDYTLWRDGPKE
ncbi:carbon-nitrogen hydrolase [Neurospora crassa]|nr:carbon-nitrogen hydrolase [Neurospora crassa]